MTYSSSSESDSDDDNADINNANNVAIPTTTNVIARIFQHNEKEPKNDCILLNVRKTVREYIFPFMKFTSEKILNQIKLIEENNILHILLRELNRLDDNEETRAQFWLRYKSEISYVLSSRKTEILNGIKGVVYEGMITCEI